MAVMEVRVKFGHLYFYTVSYVDPVGATPCGCPPNESGQARWSVPTPKYAITSYYVLRRGVVTTPSLIYVFFFGQGNPAPTDISGISLLSNRG
jgi:hypothetical protein